MNKICVLIQARTGSSRLPKKIVLPFYNDQSILLILLNRIKKAIPPEISIVVATTTSSADDAIVELCKEHNFNFFRGCESDVLNRFITAAEQFDCSAIIRICADNLFLDIDSLIILIDRFRLCKADYMSFITSNGNQSIKTHYGLWAEAVLLKSLKEVQSFTNESIYHEHVTNYIYEHSEIFNTEYIPIDPYIEAHSCLRLTIDTAIDFEIQKKIYSDLSDKDNFTSYDIIKYLEDKPEIYKKMEEIIYFNKK